MATRSQHHHGLLLLTNLASSCVALQALLWRLWRIAGHILPGYSDRKFIGIHTLPNSIRDHNSLLNLVAGKAKALDPLFQLTLAQAFIALSLFEATRTCDESTTVSAGCDGFLILFLEILNLCISLRSDRFRQAPKRNGCPLPQLIHTKTAMTNPSQHLCCLCSHWVKGRDNNKTGKPQIRLKHFLLKHGLMHLKTCSAVQTPSCESSEPPQHPVAAPLASPFPSFLRRPCRSLLPTFERKTLSLAFRAEHEASKNESSHVITGYKLKMQTAHSQNKTSNNRNHHPFLA